MTGLSAGEPSFRGEKSSRSTRRIPPARSARDGEALGQGGQGKSEHSCTRSAALPSPHRAAFRIGYPARDRSHFALSRRHPMRYLSATLLLLLGATMAPAKLVTEAVTYKHGDVVL